MCIIAYPPTPFYCCSVPFLKIKSLSGSFPAVSHSFQRHVLANMQKIHSVWYILRIARWESRKTRKKLQLPEQPERFIPPRMYHGLFQTLVSGCLMQQIFTVTNVSTFIICVLLSFLNEPPLWRFQGRWVVKLASSAKWSLAVFTAASVTSLIKPLLYLQSVNNAARWTWAFFLIYYIRLDLTREAECTVVERNWRINGSSRQIFCQIRGGGLPRYGEIEREGNWAFCLRGAAGNWVYKTVDR